MRMDSVQQYNDYFGVETLHPLVSVIDGSKAKPLRFCRKLYCCTGIFQFNDMVFVTFFL